MGSCGCGSVDRIEKAFWIKEGETVLAIHIYEGCSYCKASIAVDLYAIDADEAERDWGICLDDLVPLEPEEDLGFSMTSITIFDPYNLGVEGFGDDGIPTMEHYENLEDWLEDNGYQLIQKAIYRHDAWKDSFREE